MFRNLNTDDIKFSSFVLYTGLGLFLILYVLAWYYYQERIGLFDNAFQSFLLVCEEKIHVMAHRWPAVSVRFLPWVFVKLGAPLPIIMILFSLSYIAFQEVIFSALLLGFNRPKLALLQLAVFLMPKTHGFFWSNSEQIQGLSVLILFWASLEHNFKHPVFKWLLIAVLAVCLAYIHPLLLFPTLFLFFFDLAYKRSWNWTKIGGLMIYFFSWAFKRWLYPNYYDTMKSNNFSNHLGEYLLSGKLMPSLKQAVPDLLEFHHFSLILIAGSMALLFHYKKIIPAVFLLFYFLSYLLVVHIGQATEAVPLYMEVNYYPLLLISAFPLVYLLDTSFSGSILKSITILFFVFSICRIVIYDDPYVNRLAWIETSLEKASCNKNVMGSDQVPEDIRLLQWSFPYESLLISRERSLFVSDKKDLDMHEEDILITEFQNYPRSYFQNKYIRFPDKSPCR